MYVNKLKKKTLTGPRPSCPLPVTRKWSRRSVVAPTQKVLFVCNCCSTTFMSSLDTKNCCSGTTGRPKEVEWRPNHCHGGSRVAMVAEWRHIGQLNDRSMDAIGGIRQVEASLKLIHNVYNSTHFFTGRPMADHCTSILRPRWCVCLPHASFKRPVSDRPPRHRRPLCDCFEHAQNFTATMASMARSERLCATLERLRQHFSLHWAFNGDLARHVVAQGRHKSHISLAGISHHWFR